MKKAYTAPIAAASVAVKIPHSRSWSCAGRPCSTQGQIVTPASSGRGSRGLAQAGPDHDFVERRTQTAALVLLEEPQPDQRLHVGVHVLVVPSKRAGKRPDLQPLVASDMADQLQPLFRNRAEQLRDAAEGEPRGRLASGARLPPRTRKSG